MARVILDKSQYSFTSGLANIGNIVFHNIDYTFDIEAILLVQVVQSGKEQFLYLNGRKDYPGTYDSLLNKLTFGVDTSTLSNTDALQVIIEDKVEEKNLPYNISTGSVPKAVGNIALLPLISLRIKALSKAKLIPLKIISFNVKRDTKIVIYKNAILTGAVWTPHLDVNSNAEYDVTSTIITGGTILYDGYLGRREKLEIPEILERISLQNVGATQESITVAMRTLLGVTSDGYSSINFKTLK